MKNVYPIIIKTEVDSFGTKSVLFLTEEGSVEVLYAEEGQHHILDNQLKQLKKNKKVKVS